MVCSTSLAVAGDGNNIDVLQVSNGLIGNTLYIDQSQSTGSNVGGDRLGLLPAAQIGSANTASFDIQGSGGSLAILQNNAFSGLGIGNQADGVISGLFGFGSIQQLGDGNVATLTVNSADPLNPATGEISQLGFFNSAELSVTGRGADGTLRQVGRGNSNALVVEGAGTSASYTQIGNNNANPQGVTVVSNGGSVAITQYSF